MPILKIHPLAQKDIKRLHDFLLPKDKKAAERAVGKIREYLNKLTTSPYLGEPYGSYRRLIIPFGHSAYIVFYFSEGQYVHILRIMHGREGTEALELN